MRRVARQSPNGAPAGARAGGERRSKGADRALAGGGEKRGADFAPTRRMPSDAVASLWLEELEGLEQG